jgi:hypothetical protein
MILSVGTFQGDQKLYHKHVLQFLARSLFITFATECVVIKRKTQEFNTVRVLSDEGIVCFSGDICLANKLNSCPSKSTFDIKHITLGHLLDEHNLPDVSSHSMYVMHLQC